MQVRFRLRTMITEESNEYQNEKRNKVMYNAQIKVKLSQGTRQQCLLLSF